jgi:hypothetical protein
MPAEFAILAFNMVCAIICARWAMELGFSQFRQLLWGVAGLVGGPLVMLILYVRLLRVAPAPAQRWFQAARRFSR